MNNPIIPNNKFTQNEADALFVLNNERKRLHELGTSIRMKVKANLFDQECPPLTEDELLVLNMNGIEDLHHHKKDEDDTYIRDLYSFLNFGCDDLTDQEDLIYDITNCVLQLSGFAPKEYHTLIQSSDTVLAYYEIYGRKFYRPVSFNSPEITSHEHEVSVTDIRKIEAIYRPLPQNMPNISEAYMIILDYLELDYEVVNYDYTNPQLLPSNILNMSVDEPDYGDNFYETMYNSQYYEEYYDPYYDDFIFNMETYF